MGRLVPNTLPVKLSYVANNYFANTIAFQTDTITATGYGNISAPGNAVFCRVQVWGGGGGGGYSGSGGGGAYYEKFVPVVPGTANVFRYFVGTGGAGAPSANGVSGAGSFVYFFRGPASTDTLYISAAGGFRGESSKDGGHGEGGLAPNTILYQANVGLDGLTGNANCGGNCGGIIYTTGGSAGYGGNSSSIDGKQPGGGGYGQNTGGDGANGMITFSWYGVKTSHKGLKSFLSGANGVPVSAVGYSGMIPSSPPISLTQFRSADNVGMINSALYRFNDSGFNYTGGAAAANSALIVGANGYLSILYHTGESLGVWLNHPVEISDSNLGQYFDVRVTKIGGNGTLTGTNATWLQVNTDRHWNVYASVSSTGSNIKEANCSIEFRRRSDNTLLSNSTAQIWAHAESFPDVGNGGCGTCCFTPDTLVLMADGGWMAIAEIQVGDEITVRGGTRKVTEIITRTNRVMYEIQFADGRILKASEDHPLYVVDKGYASVNPTVEYKDLGIPDMLYVGDLVLDSDGRENQIVSIEPFDYPHTVYTFAESEFYANGMLVY